MAKKADFVNAVYQAALQAGMSEAAARVTASQAAVESGYGQHAPGNNYFGIKAGKSWSGPSNYLPTKEYVGGQPVSVKQRFRAYDTPEAGLADRIQFMDRAFPGFSQAPTVGSAYDALANGRYGSYATTPRSDYESALNYVNSRFLGGTPVPPLNVPLPPLPKPRPVNVFDTMGPVAGRVPLPAPAPLTPESMAPSLVDRLPQTAMYGLQRRLTPGKVTQPPTDFTTADLGNVDPRTLGMTAPPVLPRGVPMTGSALPPISKLGVPIAGGAAGPGAPIPMPGRPAALTVAPPAPSAPPVVQSQPQRTLPPQAPPSVPQVRLASGQMIAPGIYNQGDHSVRVYDDGTGKAKIDIVRGPGAIPGIIDPLKEVNAPTLAGGMIRSMIPKVAADAVSNFNAPAAVDNVKSAAANAASNLGSSLSGFGSGITGAFSGLGGLFGGVPRPPMPMFPTQAQMQAIRNVPRNAYYPSMPQSRPFALMAPQRVAQVAPIPVRTPNSVAVIAPNDPDRYAQQVFGNPNGGAFGGSLAGF